VKIINAYKAFVLSGKSISFASKALKSIGGLFTEKMNVDEPCVADKRRQDG
jgi:hypothetical protein